MMTITPRQRIHWFSLVNINISIRLSFLSYQVWRQHFSYIANWRIFYNKHLVTWCCIYSWIAVGIYFCCIKFCCYIIGFIVVSCCSCQDKSHCCITLGNMEAAMRLQGGWTWGCIITSLDWRMASPFFGSISRINLLLNLSYKVRQETTLSKIGFVLDALFVCCFYYKDDIYWCNENYEDDKYWCNEICWFVYGQLEGNKNLI